MDASQVLREWREKNQFTQKDVGVLFGVSQKSISKWERGICNPDPWRMYLAWMHGRHDVAILAKEILELIGDKYVIP